MPLSRIYANPDTFTLDQKRGIAAAITKHYDVLPAFYVAVIFVDCKEEMYGLVQNQRRILFALL